MAQHSATAPSQDWPATGEPQADPAPPTTAGWWRLLGYLGPYKGRMALAIIALLASTGLGLTFPLVIVRLLETVTQGGSGATLNLLAGGLLGLFLVQAACAFVQSYLLSSIGERIVFDLRTSLYRQLQRLSLDFYASRRVGEIVSRLSSDVTQMRTLLTSNLTSLLSQSVTLVGAREPGAPAPVR